MIDREKARRAFPEQCSFGISVGAILGVLGAWWLYRGKFPLAAPLFASIGGLLLLLAVVAPSALVHPHRAWMRLGEGLSFVMTRLVLLVVFVLVVTPIGLFRRLTGADPLRRRAAVKAGESAWHPYPARHLDTKHYEKSF